MINKSYQNIITAISKVQLKYVTQPNIFEQCYASQICDND